MKGQSLWTINKGKSALSDIDPDAFDAEKVKRSKFDTEALEERLKPYKRKRRRWKDGRF